MEKAWFRNRSVSVPDYEMTEPTILDIFQVSFRMGDEDVMVTFQEIGSSKSLKSLMFVRFPPNSAV
jgi:hypothetical protein